LASASVSRSLSKEAEVATPETTAARPGPRIYTIGHGNRPLDELTALLQLSHVTHLVDVRAHPGSRRHPQFGRAELEQSLPAAGIDYVWEGKTLGGRRRPRPDSPHVAMRNDSFRAYADHMETAGFREGIEHLLGLASEGCAAIMCAERLPWQCHRYMISDYLVAHEVEVLHVIDASAPRPHSLRAEARLSEGRLVYDRQSQPGLPFD
jgi:uncharacterized protein (DUF488 family)